MTIRKTGAADGRITQAGVPGEGGITMSAARAEQGALGLVTGQHTWNPEDEDGLAEENEAAGQE
jgi:hypothetical protein